MSDMSSVRAGGVALILAAGSYPLWDRLKLVPDGNLDQVHSVLLQARIDFTIYLPPQRLDPAAKQRDMH